MGPTHSTGVCASFAVTRLYAFSECDVIVDPIIDPADEFPCNPDTDPPGKYPAGVCAWGFINSRPYGERGWCCAEFAVALKNGRIVNSRDSEVQKVLAMRTWPNDLHEYAVMMDDGAKQPVRFTNKGDIAAVLYNFYKMTERMDVDDRVSASGYLEIAKAMDFMW